jgi:hypothetical protein
MYVEYFFDEAIRSLDKMILTKYNNIRKKSYRYCLGYYITGGAR